MSKNYTNDACSCCFRAYDEYEKCMPELMWGIFVVIILLGGIGLGAGILYLACIPFGLIILPVLCRGGFSGCTYGDIFGIGAPLGLPFLLVFLCIVSFIWYKCVQAYRKRYYSTVSDSDIRYNIV
jgi:hypothetical protein